MSKIILEGFIAPIVGYFVNIFAPQYLPHIATGIGLLITWQIFFILSKNKLILITPYLIRFREKVGVFMSYFIISIFGAFLAIGYFGALQKVLPIAKQNELKPSQLGTKQNNKKIIEDLLNYIGEAGGIQVRCEKNPLGKAGWGEFEQWNKKVHDYIAKEKELGPAQENFLEYTENIQLNQDQKNFLRSFSRENANAWVCLYKRKIRLTELINKLETH